MTETAQRKASDEATPSRAIFMDEEELDAALNEAFVAGYAAGQYRGQPSAADRLTDFERRAYSSAYRKWKVFNGN